MGLFTWMRTATTSKAMDHPLYRLLHDEPNPEMTSFVFREIAYDRWGAVQISQNFQAAGFTVAPFSQGFRDMSPPSKELMKLALESKLAHAGYSVLAWMVDNIHIRQNPAGNIKPDKQKSTEKINGVVATIMTLDRAIRGGNANSESSVYDSRGLIVF